MMVKKLHCLFVSVQFHSSVKQNLPLLPPVKLYKTLDLDAGFHPQVLHPTCFSLFWKGDHGKARFEKPVLEEDQTRTPTQIPDCFNPSTDSEETPLMYSRLKAEGFLGLDFEEWIF